MKTARAVERMIVTALLVLLAITCAHWFWIFVAPPASAPPQQLSAELLRPLDSIRRANLFGIAAQAVTTAPAVRTDLALRGVSASRTGGVAVIALDKTRTVTVRAGDEIAPGIRLERVAPDHVVVIQNGVSQRIELPQKKPVDTAPVASGYAGAKK
jgi:general secretion pathway protein C